MKIAETVDALAREKVAELGFALEDVEFVKEQGGWVLTLYIDKEGGITIDDCEAVSRAVDPLLDEADPIPQAYFLSVSSLGMDRPLKKDKDFQRNLGKLIIVKLYAPNKGKKELTGTLLSFDEAAFTIEIDGEPQVIARKEAAKVVPYISFE